MKNEPISWLDPYGPDVWGYNSGISTTFKEMKFSLAVAFFLDSEGNFSIDTSEEAGAGIGRSTGAFLKAQMVRYRATTLVLGYL